jgi:DNA-binding transcriptional LysR family regulator
MTVVQAGTMGKAAQSLNTTQPNISRSIAELEHALGVRLLDRHRQGIAPTEYGRALLDCGVAVFDDLRQGIKNIEFLADPAAGEVRIGSSTYVAETFVSAVIKRLSLRCPRIVFHLVTAEETGTLQRELSERNVDLLIARRVDLFTDEKFGFDRCPKPLGSDAPHRACRPGERIVGAAIARTRAWASLSGRLPRQRSRLSSHGCFRRSPRGAAQSSGDRALSYNCTDLSIEIFQTSRDQGLAH